MLRLLVKLALAAGAVVAVWTWVPVKGRTMAERWDAAPTAGKFIDRTWSELAGKAPGRSPALPRAREAAPRGRTGDRPVERHSDDDRRAVDRIVADHLDVPTKP
jgi:hypothetical protein